MSHSSAITMNAYGPPTVLQLADVALSEPRPGEVRLAAIASAVNHTDLRIRAGDWPIRAEPPFPYTPGVEVVGRIDAIGAGVGHLAVGDYAITAMQGLGGVRAERPGGYARHVTVSADAVATFPSGIAPQAMAALGLAAITALEGLRRIGQLGGRRIVVTGAAGGVGSAAVLVARALGASVTGIVSRREQVDYVRALGAEEICVSGEDRDLPGLRSGGVDGVLDTVGGALFAPCIRALRDGGTLSLVGAVGGGEAALDLWQLTRPVTLTGYSSEDLDGASLRATVGLLSESLASGRLRPPAFRTFPLAEAAAAHASIEAGRESGRVLLV